MELDLVLAQQCEREAFADANTTDNERWLEFLRALVEFSSPLEVMGGDVAPFAAAAATCRAAYNYLAFSDFWLQSIGYIVAQAPPSFCPYLLFQAYKSQDEGGYLDRNLLTDRVQEERVPGKLVPIIVHTRPNDSEAFWFAKIRDVLGLARFPTTPVVTKLQELLDLVVGKVGMTPDHLLARIAEIERPNKALTMFTIHHLWKGNKKCLVLAPLVTLLRDVESIVFIYALWRGVPLENIKDSMFKDMGLTTFPRPLARAVAHALAGMSHLELTKLYNYQGLFVAAFKSMRIGKFVKSVSEDKRGRLLLALAWVRGRRYPESEDAFTSPAGWAETLLPELKQVQKNRLLSLPVAWTADTWQPQLAKARIPKPLRKTFETVLSIKGNRTATWTQLLDEAVVTPAQVLLNLRTMLLLHVPLDRLEAMLVAAADSLSLAQIIKVHTFIKNTFTGPYVERLRGLIEAAIAASVAALDADADADADANGGGDDDDDSSDDDGGAQPMKISDNTAPTAPAPPPVQYPDEDGLVRVTMEPASFRDKKGAVHERACHRWIHHEFGEESVAAGLEMLDRVLEVLISKQIPESVYDQAMIMHTEELQNNVRSGLPSVVPEYVRTSLWRNETVCLQQLAEPDESLDKIMLGMTWCQKENGNRIDLDLSVMLFADDWTFLDHCSYQKTEITGVKHSGDITSAPYPKGARESVSVDLPTVLNAYPTCKHIAMVTFAFTDTPFDDMHDASAFVANPSRPGTGPQGMDVISAARLSGQGRCNISSYITVDREQGRHYFTSVDITVNTKGNSATAASSVVTENMRRIVEANNGPTSLRVLAIGALWASAMSNTVIIQSNDEPCVLTRDVDANEPRVHFYRRVEEAIAGITPAVSGVSHAVPDLGDGPVVVFGGELDKPSAVAWANTALTRVPEQADADADVVISDNPSPADADSSDDDAPMPAVTYCCLRADDNTLECNTYLSELEKPARINVIMGWDACDLLLKATHYDD